MPVTTEEVKTFTRDFSAKIDQGRSLVGSLNDLAAQQTNPDLKQVITDINQELQTGNTLSAAMGKHCAVFNPDQITVVRQGERAGRLEDALRIWHSSCRVSWPPVGIAEHRRPEALPTLGPTTPCTGRDCSHLLSPLRAWRRSLAASSRR